MKVLAIDQGTTGTKSFVLADSGSFEAAHASEHRQIYPQAGWVEHDPEELLASIKTAIDAAGPVDAIGIDNQGETIIAWDKVTGRPVYNAIVWQDDRTKDVTERLKAEGAEELTLKRAGLPLDPYFSASKMRWIIDHVPEAKSLLAQKRLRLGTSDAFFLDRLTGAFVTDVSTASRTSLMSLDSFAWDLNLTELFGVPIECLPDIRSSAEVYGEHAGRKVTANLVDQQAALFGHGCATAGDCKITFGTGAFALAIAGPTRVDGSRAGINPTVAWKINTERPVFAVEGGVYNAASAVNWARGLGLFESFDEISHFDGPSAISRGLAFVPSLSGLGCPYWDRTAAGLWIGMGLDTTRQDMMQSVLEGIALRAADIFRAMKTVAPMADEVSVDGGMARNGYFLQVLADVLDAAVSVPSTPDLTAMGTGRMALRGLGISELPPLPPPRRMIEPCGGIGRTLLERFSEAVTRARNWRT